MATVNVRIKEIRQSLKITQKEFAKELGISQSHLSEIESNKNSPSDMLVKLISLNFNINENWLFNGTGKVYSDIVSILKMDKTTKEIITQLASLPEETKHEVLKLIKEKKLIRELLKERAQEK